MTFNPVVIDGSLLEGGGQILRMSVGFSALLNKQINITNIRGKRSKPGLKAQHLSGILLVKELVKAEITGATLNSTQITFKPQMKPTGGHFKADTGTAGATTLLAQVSLPCLLFADKPSDVVLKGGTNADMAPQVDFYQNVFLPNLQRFGANFDCDVVRKGYFPKGGGQVNLEVKEPLCGKTLNSVELLDPGKLKKITIWSSVAGSLPVKIAEEMSDAAKKKLMKNLKDPVDIEVHSFKEKSAFGNGSSILIQAETTTGCILGGSAIGNPKKKPYQTGEFAADEILGCVFPNLVCLDSWMQDQVIIYMALAKGRSRVRTGKLTLHTETAIYISEMMTGAKFEVNEDNGTWIIQCDGIGFQQ